MTEYGQLNGLAEAEIAKLAADGIHVTPSEAVELSALGWQVECPEVRSQLARGVPVPVGGVVLWPLTIAAHDWFCRVGSSCYDPHAALAYAMAHGSEASLATMDYAHVRAWYRSITANERQITQAMAQVMRQDELVTVPDDGRHGMTDGELSAFMVATVGGTPEQWERQCSIGYVRLLIETAATQASATGKTPEQWAKDRAFLALMLAAERIRSERAKANG